MAEEPTDFLLNLAIIKINWDQQQDILHNFMPLVGYAIRQLEHDTVSIQELKETIERVAEFKIPTGALEVLIRRASKPKYGYVIRKDKVFRRVPEKLVNLNFERNREEAKVLFDTISQAFNRFCVAHFPGAMFTDTEAALFEILYNVAPRVVNSAATFRKEEVDAVSHHPLTLRYRAARFIVHAMDENAEYLPAIENFVQGAVLAESFYYSSPDALQQRFRDVKVFYDTNLLSKILGYSSVAEVEAARELHNLVLESKARIAIFEHSGEELHRIFTAASHARRYGPLKPQRPGDIFDWLNQRGYSASDIELEIAKLPEKLASAEIKAEPTLPHNSEVQVDEARLKDFILAEIPTIGVTALNADIDSLQGVFSLRRGVVQRYLDNCKAIFVTTNTALAIASTRYFNDEHAVSDAPVCITDHVFCMLLWLKTVDKKKDIPRELIVANCVAALQPTRELWDRYMLEVERLRQRGDVTEGDYILLSHSLEARQALMDMTSGDPQVFTLGSALEILEAAKDALTVEARDRLAEKTQELAVTNELLVGSRLEAEDMKVATAEGLRVQSRRIAQVRDRVATVLYVLVAGLLTAVIIIASWSSLGLNGYVYFTTKMKPADFLDGVAMPYMFWLLLFVAGILNLIFGWAFRTPARRLAISLANLIVGPANSIH